jgi:hypothetical protein
VISYTEVSDPLNRVDGGPEGQENKTSYFPSPSALNASVPLPIELAAFPETNENPSDVGLKLGVRLKYHPVRNSVADFKLKLIVSRVVPPPTSMNVALAHGAAPLGAVPPLNS